MLSDELGHIAPINDVGTLDRRVLYQRRWWFDRHARAHLLDEMPADYRRNLAYFLQCERHHLHVWDSYATLIVETRAELADVLAAGRQGLLPHQLDADTWFATRPLVARLDQLVGARPDRFTDGTVRDAIGRRDACRLHLERITALVIGLPELLHLLGQAGAAADDLAELAGHVTAACDAVSRHA